MKQDPAEINSDRALYIQAIALVALLSLRQRFIVIACFVNLLQDNLHEYGHPVYKALHINSPSIKPISRDAITRWLKSAVFLGDVPFVGVKRNEMATLQALSLQILQRLERSPR
ncbi:MAG TPA: hypothetical protein V6C84_13720 [Coleofasciculaceae cyanobacterium]